MKAKHMIHALQNNYYTISVAFLEGGGGAYTYKVPNEIELEVEDRVVVYSHDFKIARVLAVHEVADIDFNSNYDYKWIAGKVDAQAYLERVEPEKQTTVEIKRAENKKRANQALEFMKESIGEESFKRIEKLASGSVEIDC
jgi:hypothetical protein